MDLNDLTKLAADQDAGHEFSLLDPVSGKPLDMKVRIAGPDSQIAKKAREAMEAEIAKLQSRRSTGGIVSPEAREALMVDYLFAVTLGWHVKEGGQALPFSKENFTRLLNAGTWVRAQIDLFAGDRSPYFGG